MIKSKKFFTIILLGLAALLVLYGVLRSTLKSFLPPIVENNIYSLIIFAALGVFFWNRNLVKKSAEEKPKEEKEESARKKNP